jgi:hypothetical protein
MAAAKTTTVTTAGKAGILYGYALKCGTTISSVLFRDGGSSGTVRWGDGNAAVTVAGDVWKVQMFPIPIAFSTDIYVTLVGTGAVVYVAYVETED